MDKEKLRGEQKLELEQANMEWSVNTWDKWRLRNKVGLILEDGKVTGWDSAPIRYHA